MYIYVFAGECSHLVLIGSSITVYFDALAKYETSSVKLCQARIVDRELTQNFYVNPT